MRRFQPRGRSLVSHLEPDEVELLGSLTRQLVELLEAVDAEPGLVEPGDGEDATPANGPDRGAADETDDPFARWEADLAETPDAPAEHDDPVLRRLFPTAYPHDPEAASDFRRYTERDARTAKTAAAKVVLSGLAATQRGRKPLSIPRAEADAWLKTLTNLRLSLATRLQITDVESAEELSQLPESDPRAFLYGVYEWLAFAQETLVLSLSPRRG